MTHSGRRAVKERTGTTFADSDVQISKEMSKLWGLGRGEGTNFNPIGTCRKKSSEFALERFPKLLAMLFSDSVEGNRI